MLVFSYEFHETLEKPFLQNTLQITFNFCSTEKYFTNKIVNRTVACIYQTKLTLSQQFLFEKPLFRHFWIKSCKLHRFEWGSNKLTTLGRKSSELHDFKSESDELVSFEWKWQSRHSWMKKLQICHIWMLK